MTTDDGSGRFRLVHEQGDESIMGAALLSLPEVAEMLEVEQELHEAAGWRTERHGSMLRCESRAGVVRWIWPREERV